MSRFTLALDASQISQYLECPRSWYFRYYKHLSRAGQKRAALDKGSLVHQLCDLYYNLRAMNRSVPSMTHGTAVINLIKGWKNTFNLSKEDTEFLCMRFFQYAATYMANDFVPVSKNGLPAVELGFSKVLYEDENVLYVVEGRIDLIADYGGVRVFVDHKTQAQAKTLYQYCPQFLTYAWATGLDRGMINYFGLQKEMTKDTFRRQLIFFPKWKIKEWERRMLAVFNSIRANLEKSDFLPYNPEAMNQHACGGAFNSSPCMFTQLCETSSTEMRRSIETQNYEIRIWKPWEIGGDVSAITE